MKKTCAMVMALAAAGAAAAGTLTVKFGSAMEVIEGGVTNTYAQNATFTPTAIPCIYFMRPANMAEGERTFAIKGDEYISGTYLHWRFPQYGDSNWVRVALDPYPAEDTTVTLTGYKTSNFFYADAEHGNDDWDGTTADIPTKEVIDAGGTIPGPKKSLQAANDVATGDYPIVFAAPGVYNTGVATNVTYSKDGETPYPCIRRLIATKSGIGFIATEGAENTFIVGAPDTSDANGNGTESVSGVYMHAGNAQFLQGFTITGCYAPANPTGNNQFGPAFCSGGTYAYCLDCVISNNYSLSEVTGGTYGSTCYGVMERARIIENESYRFTTRYGVFISCIFAGNVITWQDSTGSNRALHYNSQTYFCTYDLRNRLQKEGRKRVEDNDSSLRAALVYGLTEKSETTTNATRWLSKSMAIDAPLFANADARDYRLGVKSPAKNLSSYEEDLNSRARMVMTSDVDGRMPVLHDGKLTLGAVWNEPQVWYVAQDGGNDANDGTSPETSKATINAAIALSFSGDTIRVAPGMYGAEEGDHRTSASANAGFRVIVPEGITLESTDGAEKTFIVGADAPAENIDNETYKTGEGGVRCVCASNGAVVCGFTLTGGRGVGGSSGSNSAAAFYSPTALGATIEDCIVSNNAAYSQTIRQAVVKRCRVFENAAICDLKSGAAGSACSWYGSIIDKNKGDGTVYNADIIENCTIGGNNAKLTVANPQVVDARTVSVVINNSVILGGRQYGADSKISCSNCLITGSGVTSWSAVPEAKRYNTEISTTVKASVDSEYRPSLGEFAGIDMEGAEYSDALGDKDVYGNPRVLNGAIDVGAVEYDWRPKFAQAVGKRKSLTLTLTDVSPSVTTNAAGGLLIPSGVVAGTISECGKFTFAFELSGGSIEAFVGGESKGVFPAGGQPVVLEIPDADTEFRFVFTPDSESPASAVLRRISAGKGFVVSFR